MNWNNKVTRLLRVRYPFIQAPMLVVSTPAMVAAAAEAGALGSLPLGYSTADNAREKIRAVKSLTQQHFAVNCFAYAQTASVAGKLSPALRSYYEAYHIPVPDALPASDPFTYYTDLLELFVEEKIPVISFHFGLPAPDVVQWLKARGIVLMATATSVAEARMAEESGMDLVVAQGIEAGGNRGSFADGPLPEVGLISLLPQLIEAVTIPVIAAGGLMQPSGIAAAFVMGAEGVQLGSAFLRAAESGAPPSWKQAITRAADTSSVLTRSWSGRYGRCLANEFTRSFPEADILPGPFQHYLTSKLREVGRLQDLPEIQSLWAGQSAGQASEQPVASILKELIEGTAKRLDRPFEFS